MFSWLSGSEKRIKCEHCRGEGYVHKRVLGSGGHYTQPYECYACDGTGTQRILKNNGE